MTNQIRNPNGEGRVWPVVGSVVVTLALLCAPLRGSVAREAIGAGVEAAIDRGLLFLAKQQKMDGSFEAAGPSNAATGLAVLAFLSAGHTPEVGKYGVNVRRAVDHLLTVEAEDGYFGGDGGRMVSHAIVTVALAEVYGMEADARQRERVRLALEKTLRVIYAAQDVKKERDARGGWRHEPESEESDLSATGWCVLAMRACQNAGLVVPKQRVDRAAGYVARCFRPEQGGFGYTPDGEATAGMTGVGVLSLYLLDEGQREEAAEGVRFLMRRGMGKAEAWWYHGVYFVTMAGNQVGGTAWSVVWKRASVQLLAKQRREDGSWDGRADEVDGEGKAGRVYATAMACLTLSVPGRVLPVYQR